MSSVPKLMWVTDQSRQRESTVDLTATVVSAGVDAIHIREKSLPTAELQELTIAVQSAVGDDALVIVNSDAEVARNIGVGLHLPEAADFRSLRMEDFASFGRSVHSKQAAAASAAFDYVIAGHVYDTGSKAGRPPIGIEGLAAIVAVAPVPVLAIGGIRPENVSHVLAAGAHGIAIMSGIGSASNPAVAALAYRKALDEHSGTL